MDINGDRLDDVIEKARKGSQDSWALLTLLYPSHNYRDVDFHEDHIYPYSKLSKHQKISGGDYIANIQLLEGVDNSIKNDRAPEDWMSEYCTNKNFDLNDYKTNNFIPLNLILSFENFDEFINVRKQLIKKCILNEIQKNE